MDDNRGQYVTRLLHGSYAILSYQTLSYDKVYNTSNVLITVSVTNRNTSLGGGNASCYISGSCGLEVSFDGQRFNSSPDCTLDENTRDKIIFSKQYTFKHDDNGKRTARIYAEIYNVNIVRGGNTEIVEKESVGGYASLINIPQASEFSEISRDVTVDGANTLTLKINPLNDECKHDLIISLGNKSQTIMNVNDTNISFVIPTEWLSEMPTTLDKTGLISLITYDSAGNKMGDGIQTYWYAHVPDNAIPRIDGLTVEQIQGAFPLSLGWVQHASRAAVTVVNAHSDWGAEITEYYISGCGYNGTESVLTTGTINRSGEQIFKAYVTDSRGRTSEVITTAIVVQPYRPPRFTNVLSQRCDSDMTLKNEGSFMLSTVTYTFDSFNGKNTIQSEEIYYKKSTDTEYVKLTTGFINDGSALSNVEFDIDTAYDIQYRLTDMFGSSYYDDVLSKSHISMEFLRGGKGISFGKEAEIENAADFGYKMYARKGLMPILLYTKDDGVIDGINLLDYTIFLVYMTDKYQKNKEVVINAFKLPGEKIIRGSAVPYKLTDEWTYITESNEERPAYRYSQGDIYVIYWTINDTGTEISSMKTGKVTGLNPPCWRFDRSAVMAVYGLL